MEAACPMDHLALYFDLCMGGCWQKESNVFDPMLGGSKAIVYGDFNGLESNPYTLSNVGSFIAFGASGKVQADAFVYPMVQYALGEPKLGNSPDEEGVGSNKGFAKPSSYLASSLNLFENISSTSLTSTDLVAHRIKMDALDLDILDHIVVMVGTGTDLGRMVVGKRGTRPDPAETPAGKWFPEAGKSVSESSRRESISESTGK
ncbi:hypothetical protein IFM89_017288 [Coptis chinensis]|uniref:Uncharacterized protein n=1 Tax=Coptis chinensis TaxID=261450 RepID=A0A835IEI5_9MAGN|nr:hypothetical protein IFM89_017288 [Coptis chinensis]